MMKHPLFGDTPNYASADKQEPHGWHLLRVFDGDGELMNVVEVDVAAGWYRQARLDELGQAVVDGEEFVFDRFESARLRLEWAS